MENNNEKFSSTGRNEKGVKTFFESIAYLLIFLAIQILVTFGVQKLWQLVTGSPDLTAMSVIVSMAVFSVVAIAVFALTRWTTLSRDYLRTRPWAVLLWCAFAAVGAIIPSSWLQEQMPELPNTLLGEFDLIMRNRWGYLAVGLLAPIAEEMVFRGAVLRTLLKCTRFHWVAIAVSALLFAVSHGNPAQMPHAFLVGLLLGWMYYRTGSIIPSVTYHWVNNSIAYALYNVMPDPNAPLISLFGGSERTVILALLFSLCILVPSILQLNLRMRKG